MQNYIIPASAAAVSNMQARMVSTSSGEREGSVPDASNNCADLQDGAQDKQGSPCTDQNQEAKGEPDDSQMRAFRGVLRVVLVVLESCLSLAGFPVPGSTSGKLPCAAAGKPGDMNEEKGADAGSTASLHYARMLAEQQQQWCSCLAMMWRNILDCLSSGEPFKVSSPAPCRVPSLYTFKHSRDATSILWYALCSSTVPCNLGALLHEIYTFMYEAGVDSIRSMHFVLQILATRWPAPFLSLIHI